MQLVLWLTTLRKTKFQATKFSLLSIVQRIFLLLMRESKPPFSCNCTFTFFMKLIARNQLLRFALHCCVIWKVYTNINTCPASADLMGVKGYLSCFCTRQTSCIHLISGWRGSAVFNMSVIGCNPWHRAHPVPRHFFISRMSNGFTVHVNVI